MFSIYKGGEHFYQWDIGQRLVVDDETITKLHFCNGLNDCAYVTEVQEVDGLRLANVPNILLQQTNRIRVYGCIEDGEDVCFSKDIEIFRVIPKNKPDDYIYTEEEIKNYTAIEDRIKAIESDIDYLEELGLDTLEARIDNLVANASNTEENSELIDIRIGADGTAYTSAGEAVRTQIGVLNTNTSNITNSLNEDAAKITQLESTTEEAKNQISALEEQVEELNKLNYEAVTETVSPRLEFDRLSKLDITISDFILPTDKESIEITLRQSKNMLNPAWIGRNALTGWEQLADGREFITKSCKVQRVDNTIVCKSGTATANLYIPVIDASANVVLPAGTYRFDGCPSGGSSSTYAIQWKNADSDTTIGFNYGDDSLIKTFNTAVKIKINAIVYSGYTCSNLVFQPRIIAGADECEFDNFKGTSLTLTADTALPITGLQLLEGYNAIECLGDGTLDITYGVAKVVEDGEKLNVIEKKLNEVENTLLELSKSKHIDDTDFTISYLNNSNYFSQNDITFVGDELWVSKESATYYKNGTMLFRYKINNGDFELVGSCDCDFGHLNTMDYCAANDCLIFGNGGNGFETEGNYFTVVKNPLALGETALIADVGIKYNVDVGYKVQALWGHSNLGENNIVYLLSNDSANITKVLLKKDSNGDFNGEYVILESVEVDAWGVQGADIYGDTLYIGGTIGGNEYAAVKEISLSDYSFKQIVKQKYYANDGSAIAGCVQGIYVNQDAVWICINSGDTTKPVCLTKYHR